GERVYAHTDKQHGQTDHSKHYHWTVMAQHRKKDKGHDSAGKPAESIRSSGGSGTKGGGEDLALQDMETARENVADHSVCKSEDHNRRRPFGITEAEPKYSHEKR